MLRSKRLQTVDTVQALFVHSKERAGSGSPDQGEDTFGDHGAVEDPASLALTRQATGHDRRLRAVETRNSAASDAHKHHREDRQPVRLAVVQAVGELRHLRAVPAQHNDHDTYAHEQQHSAEDGIEPANELVHGQNRSQRIIRKDDQHPGDGQQTSLERHGAQGSQALQQGCGPTEEGGGEQQEQY